MGSQHPGPRTYETLVFQLLSDEVTAMNSILFVAGLTLPGDWVFLNMSFPDPNRALLNPRFDGYKFEPLEHDEVISHYPLEHKVSQTNVSVRAPLSFQEVQSRVTHNHLAICNQSRRAAYVDAELRVIGIDVDEVSRVLSIVS